MNEQQQLSGRDLNRAIAETLGYTIRENGISGVSSLYDAGGQKIGYWDTFSDPVMRFHADANAVIDVCCTRGWRLSFGYNAHDEPAATIEVWGDGYKGYGGYGATPQEAAARALLVALKGEQP